MARGRWPGTTFRQTQTRSFPAIFGWGKKLHREEVWLTSPGLLEYSDLDWMLTLAPSQPGLRRDEGHLGEADLELRPCS